MNTSWILALDASTPRSVVVLGRVHEHAEEVVAADEQLDGANQASGTLLPRVQEILARGGIGARDLSAVACGRGPGTFTGTRVAIASAMGLALGAGCPAVGVSTLAAVAASAVGPHAATVLALLDARRGEVYGGAFTCVRDEHGAARIEAIGDERCMAIDALLQALQPTRPTRAIGPGVAPWEEPIRAQGIEAIEAPGPTAAGLLAASAAAWRAGAAAPPESLRAVYLRQSYAELGVNAPKRPFVKSPFV